MAYRLLLVVLTVLGVLAPAIPVTAGSAACDSRNNNTFAKLLECVTVDGVRQHQAAFQTIAAANGGTRASGTPGYDASVDYVVELLQSAGYQVTVQPFDYVAFSQLGPSTLEQTAPVPTTYAGRRRLPARRPDRAGERHGPSDGRGRPARPRQHFRPAAARRTTSPGSHWGTSRSSSAAPARSS